MNTLRIKFHTALVLLASSLFCLTAHAFVHPGGLHTQADLDRMKAKVAANEHPWIDGWNALLADTATLLTYNNHATANMGNSRQNASLDAHAAYNAVIRWYVTGDTAYADKAVQICNAWSAVVNTVPTGTDIPGLSGIPVAEFAYVGEILRIYSGWAPADFARFKTMMLTYWYPVCHDFLTRHNDTCDSHYWANWDACNIGALIGIGVLCDDQAIYDEGVEYFKNGPGSGSIGHAVYFIHPDGLGQWQESGRDQEHAQLGVGLLGTSCEVAWHQGLDLYGYSNNRLLAGAEYTARTNLSEPVPFLPYNNCDNVNQYYLSTNGIGRLDDRPLWEMIYNHYVVRKGLSAPNVQAIAQLMRPEHGSTDHFGYGTLTFTLDAAASPYPSSPVPPTVTGLVATAGVSRVMLTWDPSFGDTAQGFRVQRATTSGGPYTTLSSWNANTYPQYTDTSVTNGATYYYVVAANNQSGTGTNSAEVSATPAAAGALPDGWARQDIGSVNSAGGVSYANVSNGTFIVTGNGSGIGGTADSLSYAYGAVTGDCTMTGRLLISGNIKVGFMMRESLSADSKTLSLTLGDVGGRETFFGTRSTTGGSLTVQQGNDYTWTPVWYKLQRAGDVFTAFQSLDGVTWYAIGAPSTVAMSSVYTVGLAVCGGTAIFDNLNVAAVFLAGPPANLSAVNAPNQVALSWTASAGATSYNVKRASTSGGPYTTLAAGLTTTGYTDSGLPNGAEYYYVVSATQDTYESANSNEVLGLPGDISFNWSATPGSANWSLGANWVGGAAPGNGASLTFGLSGTTSLNNDIAGLSLNRITYTSGAPAFTLAGNAVTLGGKIVNSSSSTQMLNLNLALTSNQTINANTGGVTVGGVISGAYGLVKAGSQPLSLTGQNTFTGDVIHNTGTLSIAGVGTGTAGSPTAGALGRGTLRLGGGLLTSSTAATVFNNLVLQNGTTTSIASNTANITLAGNISGSGNITESGANVGGTHFNGDNSGFTGTFTSSNATNHRVRFNRTTAGSANATWVLNNSQTDGNGLAIAGGGTISFGALSGGGQFRSDAGNNTTVTLSVGALNTNTTFNGVMVVNGTQIIALTKIGTGTLTLTGANTYIGATTVAAGALLVNNTFKSPVTVNAGTFGGTGSSNSPITVNTGGSFAPGNLGIGTFTTTGALTLNSGAIYALQFNSSNSTADKIVATGVSLAGASLNASDLGTANLVGGATFTIIDNTSANPVSGTFAGLPEGATFTVGANLFRITYAGGTGNDVVLSVILPATVTLSNLAQTYDGAPKPVTVSTAPGGLTVNVSYNGSATPPVNAGSYAVVATIADPIYLGSATGTLVIGKADAVVTLGNFSQTYDGSPKAVSLSTVPAGLPVVVTYDGSATVPTDAGSYAAVAVVSNPNYTGSASGTLVIGKAGATITLASLAQPYNGTPRVVTATTTPADLTVDLAYNGAPAAPVYPGSYPVVATINEPNYEGSVSATLTVGITALVRHAPTLNSIVDGSVQLLLPESVTLNSTGAVAGDLLVPGTPNVQLNGQPTFMGPLDGPGSSTPSNYTVTLNHGSVLRYLVRRIDPITMPMVAAPPASTGTRTVVISTASQSIGDFATLKNLTLNGSAGIREIPPGTYGAFAVNGSSGLVLGVEGATEPAVYNFQSLTLNTLPGSAKLQIVGPVIVTLANGTLINGTAGSAAHPEWLTLQIATGGLTISGTTAFNGNVIAPNGTVTLNSNATLNGTVVADRLTLNGTSLLNDPKL